MNQSDPKVKLQNITHFCWRVYQSRRLHIHRRVCAVALQTRPNRATNENAAFEKYNRVHKWTSVVKRKAFYKRCSGETNIKGIWDNFIKGRLVSNMLLFDILGWNIGYRTALLRSFRNLQICIKRNFEFIIFVKALFYLFFVRGVILLHGSIFRAWIL